MLKALIRKHMAEVGSYYLRDKKSGKHKRGKGRKGMIILLAFLYVCMGLSFGALSALFFSTTVPIGADWLGWTLVGIMGILMSVLINAFLSYSQLYAAKDNELMLAMPIPSGAIVQSKLVGVYLMSLIYFGMIWPFSMVFYWIYKKGITLTSVVFPIIMFFVIGVLILALTCILAWIIAGVMNRLKGKKFVIVAISALMIFALYYFQIKSNKIFTTIAENTAVYVELFKAKAYPLYLMGSATTGDVKCLLVFTAGVLVLMAVVYYAINKTFIRIATTKHAAKKVEYKETAAKEAPIFAALTRKEKLRFTGSVNYMLNCGMGILFVVALIVLSIIKKELIVQKMDELSAVASGMEKFMPIAVAASVSTLASMIDISAPSVSLEGKSIWVLQTMPVDPADVLMAKFNFCYRIQGACAIVMGLVMSNVLGLESSELTAVLFYAITFTFFSSMLGVWANLKRPNVSWTNEIVPIKQGASVAITLFGGWLLTLPVIGLFIIVKDFLDPAIYLGIWAAVFFGVFYLMKNWVRTKGAEIFAHL